MFLTFSQRDSQVEYLQRIVIDYDCSNILIEVLLINILRCQSVVFLLATN